MAENYLRFPSSENSGDRTEPLSNRNRWVIPRIEQHTPTAPGPLIFQPGNEFWRSSGQFAVHGMPSGFWASEPTTQQQNTPPPPPIKRSQTQSSAGPAPKQRAPNWSDPETRHLLEIWKDHSPLPKRNNLQEWDAISKELNAILSEQGIRTYRTGAQCKQRLKNLEDDYKRAKDHNNKSGNDPDTEFSYFEELDSVLGCKPRITPKNVMEGGFACAADSASAARTPSPSTRSATPSPLAGCSVDYDSDEEPTDEAVREAEKAFGIKRSGLDKPKPAPKRKGDRSKGKAPVAKKSRSANEEIAGGFMDMLKETQKSDHEFFEKLAEKEGEREMRSQQHMLSAITEIAKIFAKSN